ncbi:MAG: tetratricopeptide repeat protein [Candidatus Thermoplasmatota archaeon]
MTPSDEAGATRKLGASALLEQANAAYDAGDYPRALSLFDEAMASGVDTEVAHNNRAAALDALGQCGRAAEGYMAAVKRSPGYELAWHNLGNCLLAQGLFEGAADAYKRASSLNPSRVQNLAGLANSYSKLGRVRRAKAVVDRMLSSGSRDPALHLMAAEILLDLGLYEAAADACREHMRLRGDSPEAMSLLGTAYHESGNFAMAVQSFEKALVMSPNNKEILNNMGYSLFCAGFLDPALAAFDRALAIDPGYKHAWYNKGYAYHGAERLNEAVECYRKALEIDHRDRVLWNNLGNALYNLGRFADSVPLFVEALKVDPDYEIAWNNIGNALEKMGMWAEAIPFHERSLEIRPDFDYALYAKGMCLSMTGRPEEGYDLILESIALNPDYDEAWKAKSRVARMLGRWDEALNAIEEALAVNPGYADGWADRGDILSAMGDSLAAEASYRTSLNLFPPMRSGSQGESAQLRRKGNVLLRLGKFSEATELLCDAMTTRTFDPGIGSDCIKILRVSTQMPIPEGLRDALESVRDPCVLLDYCELLLDRGMHDEALVVLERVSVNDASRARISYLEARAYARAGLPEDEVEALLSGVSCAAAHRLKGELAEAKGELAAAESEYIKAIGEEPSDYTSSESLARVRLRMGRPKEALDAARTALGIDPTEPGATGLIRRAHMALAGTAQPAAEEEAAGAAPGRKDGGRG